jgi:hypothetical protein
MNDEWRTKDCSWSWNQLSEIYETDCEMKIYFNNNETIEDVSKCPGCGRPVVEKEAEK